ncbi:MAG: rhodanese-like domain-containing protein [Planctomycetes bacterium]|nr:rhodanese-like domain-containing protein [Planctomycetota bacterium]
MNSNELPHGNAFKPDWEVTPTQAQKWLDSGENIMIVDVRVQPEWDFAHVKGSVLVPLDQLETRAPEIEGMLEENPGCKVLTLCHHGVRSLKAAAFLRDLGIPDVKSIAGGIELWSRTADTNLPRYERQGMSVWPAGSKPV